MAPLMGGLVHGPGAVTRCVCERSPARTTQHTSHWINELTSNDNIISLIGIASQQGGHIYLKVCNIIGTTSTPGIVHYSKVTLNLHFKDACKRDMKSTQISIESWKSSAKDCHSDLLCGAKSGKQRGKTKCGLKRETVGEK